MLHCVWSENGVRSCLRQCRRRKQVLATLLACCFKVRSLSNSSNSTQRSWTTSVGCRTTLVASIWSLGSDWCNVAQNKNHVHSLSRPFNFLPCICNAVKTKSYLRLFSISMHGHDFSRHDHTDQRDLCWVRHPLNSNSMKHVMASLWSPHDVCLSTPHTCD